MLRFENIALAQGDFRLTADFEVPRGITAVIGPSGAGKSTLLSAVAGFLSPASGRILWDGADITPDAPGDRPVTTLFQDNNLFPHLSIAENVGLGLSPSLKLSGADREKIAGALARTGLEGLETRRPAALSGGQQSRAALARALVRDRPVVLLDEPFSALGPGLRAEMLDLVAKTLPGRTILMVTHDPGDAARVADRTIFVADGAAAAPVDTATLFADPPPELKAYLGGT